MKNTKTFNDHVQSLINKQKQVQTSKVRTQQAHNKEFNERVYTFTNKEMGLTSNPEKVRIMLKKLLKDNTVEEIRTNLTIRTKIAKAVNITVQRANVLIRDNIDKVANG